MESAQRLAVVNDEKNSRDRRQEAPTIRSSLSLPACDNYFDSAGFTEVILFLPLKGIKFAVIVDLINEFFHTFVLPINRVRDMSKYINKHPLRQILVL